MEALPLWLRPRFDNLCNPFGGRLFAPRRLASFFRDDHGVPLPSWSFGFLRPDHSGWAERAALAAFCLWRFGMHKAGIFVWTFRSDQRSSSCRGRQALAEAFASFILMLAIVAFQEPVVHLNSVIIAGIASLALGIYRGWHSLPNPSATQHSDT